MNLRKKAGMCILFLFAAMFCASTVHAAKASKSKPPFAKSVQKSSKLQAYDEDAVSDEVPLSKQKKSAPPAAKPLMVKISSSPPDASDDEQKEAPEKKSSKPSSSTKNPKKKSKAAEAAEAESDDAEATPSEPKKAPAILEFFKSTVFLIILLGSLGVVVVSIVLYILVSFISNWIKDRKNRLKYKQSLKPAYTSMGEKTDSMQAAINL
ncbi:uncharacterized protein NEMAJ01_0074 [Nematocida major]|uniref:uncharacterized protein n=1 Tax=Nematocida major TaxID=1912982 RepID=UPI00200725C8|nr:uncharacterized protein NEMAJ01_0074 [Nematocida major]KAH9385178.1 hypothetical protein NEMAJ01_0074 [Nematocida major]